MFQQIDLQIEDSAIFQSHADYSWGFAATKVTVSLELQFCESAFSKCYN